MEPFFERNLEPLEVPPSFTDIFESESREKTDALTLILPRKWNPSFSV